MEERQPNELMFSEQRQILRKKLDLMQIWCVFLYNVEHRCIMNVISSYFLAGQEVTLKTIQPYRNSLNLVTELRDGFLVSLIERKSQKTSLIRMNANFFILLPRIMEMIKAQINPQLQKIKQFNPLEKKKVCTNCKIQKTEQQLKFMGVRCQCATPNFVDIKQDREKKERLQQIQHLLQLVIFKRKEIDDLENMVQKLIRQKRDQKDKKLSDFQKFCQKFKLDANSTSSKIQKNYETLTEAFKLFAPKNSYSRIEELAKIREARRN